MNCAQVGGETRWKIDNPDVLLDDIASSFSFGTSLINNQICNFSNLFSCRSGNVDEAILLGYRFGDAGDFEQSIQHEIRFGLSRVDEPSTTSLLLLVGIFAGFLLIRHNRSGVVIQGGYKAVMPVHV